MKVTVGPLTKQEPDEYVDKFGYEKNEVEYCYDTIKHAEAIQKDKKKMAAVKYFAENEKDEADDVIDSIESMEAALNKRRGTEGKEVYDTADDNNYNDNAENYVEPKDEEEE